MVHAPFPEKSWDFRPSEIVSDAFSVLKKQPYCKAYIRERDSTIKHVWKMFPQL